MEMELAHARHVLADPQVTEAVLEQIADRFKKIRIAGRSRTLRWPEERARIVTPAGELTLLADEYSVVRDLRPYVEAIGSGATLHVMGGGAAQGDLEARVFYLMTRGLRRADALTLLLPEVDDQAFAWLSMDDFSDVGEYERALAEHAAGGDTRG